MNPSINKKISNFSFLIPDYTGGGAERIVIQLANLLSAKGHQVDIVTLQNQGPLATEVGQNIRKITLNKPNAYAAIPAIYRYIKHEQPASVMTTHNLLSLIILIVKKVSFAKTHFFIRQADAPSQKIRKQWKRVIERVMIHTLYPSANGIIAVSQGVAEDLSKYANIDERKITVIYNPTLPPDFELLTEQLPPHPWYLKKTMPIILGAGRFDAQKGFDLLLQTFSLVRKVKECRLIILGEGNLRKQLEAQVESLGLIEYVSLPGFYRNPYVFMKHSDVFVLSSRFEGLPNVLIQALACHCPCVSFDCPAGPAEILDNGKYGKLIKPGDINGLTDAIIKTLEGQHLQASDEWLSQFTTEIIGEKYEKILSM